MSINKENSDNISDLLIECHNLSHLTKLIVKDILKFAVKFNRQLDEDNPLIIQLLRVLECVTKHGLKPKKLLNSVPLSMLSNTNIDPWPVICDLLNNPSGGRNSSISGSDIIETVQQMGLKSGPGKYRAWLKLALMQKQLGDYYRFITEQTKKLEIYYYPAAMLLSEQGVEISGLLVGLSVIECNFVKFKDNLAEFDGFTGVLNFSQYMSNDYDGEDEDEDNDDREKGEDNIQNLMDQKQYTEELNYVIQSKLTKTQEQLANVEKELQTTKLQLVESTNRGLSLSNELDRVRAEGDQLKNRYEHRSKLMQDDLEVERSTYQTSRQELYQMNVELEKRLKEEINLRLESEKALHVEIQKKSDIEIGMDTLEKQVQEKQQTIMGVRKQLEQVKSVNLDLNSQFKELQSSLDHKASLIDKLEEKTKGMSHIIDQMDQRIKKLISDKSKMEKDMEQLQRNNKELEDEKVEASRKSDLYISQINKLKEDIDLLTKERTDLLVEKEKMLEKIEFYELENRETKIRCQEQAEALEDMAKLVENSKLESEDLREMQLSIREAKWTDDKEVTDCIQCQRPFNVSRRKHHCRRCGGVFCHDCSSSRMALASSAKPMRVCDTCLNILMKNYTSNSANEEETK